MSPRLGKALIGTSGYQYDHWSGIFYPEELARDEWFAYYATHFDVVEINNTFYGLPESSTFDHWRRQAPPGFCYVLKFSRYGSHLRKLRDPERSIATFMDRAEHLGPTLGPILVQLPPHWRADAGRLAAFLEAAPTKQRWALEFRDPSWLCESVFQVLRQYNAALCIHDLIPDHPRVVTADWVYLRFHGAGNGGDYPCQVLSGAARRIRTHLKQGRDVFAFFNNDAHGYALSNATDLIRYVATQND